MKNIETICAKYELKLRRSDRGRSWKYSVEEQVAHYRAALIHNRAVEVMTSQVLDVEGVGTIVYPYYYAFARSLDKLKRHGLAGESLAIEAAILTGTWVARGLSQDVLETIRTQVFDVGPPTP